MTLEMDNTKEVLLLMDTFHVALKYHWFGNVFYLWNTEIASCDSLSYLASLSTQRVLRLKDVKQASWVYYTNTCTGNHIRLSEMLDFEHWINRIKYKEIYWKWFCVLIQSD